MESLNVTFQIIYRVRLGVCCVCEGSYLYSHSVRKSPGLNAVFFLWNTKESNMQKTLLALYDMSCIQNKSMCGHFNKVCCRWAFFQTCKHPCFWASFSKASSPGSNTGNTLFSKYRVTGSEHTVYRFGVCIQLIPFRKKPMHLRTVC